MENLTSLVFFIHGSIPANFHMSSSEGSQDWTQERKKQDLVNSPPLNLKDLSNFVSMFQVYIKLDQYSKSRNEESTKFCFLPSWCYSCKPSHDQRQLYFYHKVRVEKFPGEISKEIIKSARDTLRAYKIMKENFKEKINSIRVESQILYDKVYLEVFYRQI